MCNAEKNKKITCILFSYNMLQQIMPRDILQVSH